MSPNRPFIIAASCGLLLPFAACSSSNNGPIIPEGDHHGYVVSKVNVPADNGQVDSFSLDLGGLRSSALDGTPENKIGGVLEALISFFHFDLQTPINTAVNQGKLLLLVDFQTKDFTNASASGLTVKLGENPVPAACNSATDTTCGNHLKGDATFSVAADSPMDDALAGKISGGTFNGGPGNLALQIALGSSTPITLSLINARVQATSISDAGMTAILAGEVTNDDLNQRILPVIQLQLAAIMMAGCTQPGCACTGTANSLKLLDANKDCTISLDELTQNPTIKAQLTPDVCSTSSCTTPDALSIGIQVQAVKATFPL